MLIVTTKISKKKLALGFAVAAGLGIALILALTGRDSPTRQEEPAASVYENVTTNEDRLALLNAAGYEVTDDPLATLDLLLPDPLDESYEAYNQLQLLQGFDLTPYCGKRLTRYTYAITNYPDIPQGVQANLYLCGSTVVAGDLFYAGANGFTAPLFTGNTIS